MQCNSYNPSYTANVCQFLSYSIYVKFSALSTNCKTLAIDTTEGY